MKQTVFGSLYAPSSAVAMAECFIAATNNGVWSEQT